MKNRLTMTVALVLVLLLVFTQTVSANEIQVNLLMAGVNLGWAVGTIELVGIPPEQQAPIDACLRRAAGFIGNAQNLLPERWASLRLTDLIPDLQRFWTYTASWTIDQRASYIRNVYNRLKHKIGYFINSSGDVQIGGNCDTAYIDVGYYFGRANMGALFGNESYRNSAQGSMNRAINNGLQAARNMPCEFGTWDEWDALPLTSPYTAAVYAAALQPLVNIAFSMAIAPPPPPPPPPTALSLAGSWRYVNEAVVEFRASGSGMSGIITQPPDWQIRMGFTQGEQIYNLTEISGNTYSGQAKIRDQSGNVYWGRVTITVSGDSLREEVTMPNGMKASGTATRIVR